MLNTVNSSAVIKNSTITGDRQGILARLCTMELENCTVACTGKYLEANAEKYTVGKNWGSGNEVPSAAIVVGDNSKNYGSEDEFQVVLTVVNTIFEVQGAAKSAVVSEDDNSKVSLTLDDDSKTSFESVLDDRRAAQI